MIKIIMPYYDNPGMLRKHVETWSSWPAALQSQFSAVVVDDGSPTSAAVDAVGRKTGIALEIYRVKEDRPWHQHGARNLGAMMAGPDRWMLLTDVDHVVEEDAAGAIVDLLPSLDWRRSYWFQRRSAEGAPIKHHPNTWLIHPRLYWMTGGYDEDFCGIYGTDGLFRDSAMMWTADLLKSEPELPTILSIALTAYTDRDLPDAGTRGLPRKEQKGRRRKRAALERAKQKAGLWRPTRVLDFDWERVR